MFTSRDQAGMCSFFLRSLRRKHSDFLGTKALPVRMSESE